MAQRLKQLTAACEDGDHDACSGEVEYARYGALPCVCACHPHECDACYQARLIAGEWEDQRELEREYHRHPELFPER